MAEPDVFIVGDDETCSLSHEVFEYTGSPATPDAISSARGLDSNLTPRTTTMSRLMPATDKMLESYTRNVSVDAKRLQLSSNDESVKVMRVKVMRVKVMRVKVMRVKVMRVEVMLDLGSQFAEINYKPLVHLQPHLLKEWYYGNKRQDSLLWITGLPGVGKTISAQFAKIRDMFTSSTGLYETPAALVRGQARSLVSNRRMLPIQIEGNTHNAVPDTGSVVNVMSEDFARQIGATLIEVQAGVSFSNARGNEFISKWKTNLPCGFPRESASQRMYEFSVVSGLAVPLIMGSEFLRITETLTRFRNRLVKVASKALTTWRVLQTQLPRQRLSCSLDGEMTSANADTGSNIDLISLNYARQRKLKLQPVRQADSYVELANGEITQLVGRVDCELTLSNELSSTTKRRRRTFYVLPELTSDVLLGDDALDELDVFNLYQDSFVDFNEFKPSIDLIYWYGKAGWPSLQTMIDDAKTGVLDTQLTCDTTSTSRLRRLLRRSKPRIWRAADVLGSDSVYERYLQIIADRNEREKDLSERRILQSSGQARTDAQRDEEQRLQNYESLRRELAALHEAKKLAMQEPP